MDEELRTLLLRLIRYKFATYPNVAILADDIVQEAYLRLRSGKTYSPDKENYGYLFEDRELESGSIRKVALQLYLLALNVAIESARIVWVTTTLKLTSNCARWKSH